MRFLFRLFMLLTLLVYLPSARAQLNFSDGTIYDIHVTPQDVQAPFFTKIADVDDDGKLDVVTGSYSEVSVFYGNGDGTLTPPHLDGASVVGRYRAAPLGTSGSVFGVEVCDVNNDGRLDIVATNNSGSHSSYGLVILTNQGNRQFSLTQTLQTDLYAGNVVVGNFNQDAFPDLAVPCYTGHNVMGHVAIYLNDGSGMFTREYSNPVDNDLTNTPSFTLTDDFNHDGYLDLAVSSWWGNPSDRGNRGILTILLGDGAGHFDPMWIAPFDGMEADGSFSGDVNEDGEVDIVQVVRTTNQLYIHLGNGDGTFRYGTPVSLSVSDVPIQPVLADLDGDGHLDLACTNSTPRNTPRTLLIYHGDGQGHFGQNGTPDIVKTLSYNTQGLAAADMNGDGQLDLVATAPDLGIVVFLNQSDATPPVVTFSISPTPNPMGWTNADTTLQINATDNVGGSGVARITYQITSQPGVPNTVNGSSVTLPPFTQEGEVTVSAFATDNAGNGSQVAHITLKIDKTKPTTLPTVLGSQVTLSATDSLSGVDNTYFTVDGGAQQTYNGPITLPSTGAHSLTFWSVDKAGNAEATQTLTAIGNDTYVTVTSVTGMVGQKKTLTARLRKTGSNVALANQSVTFKVDGTVVGSDTTNASGVATLVYTLPETIGTQTIEASFAGDATNDPSTGAGTLTVTFANTVITVANKTYQAGDTFNLSATLKRVGDGAIAGKSVTFKVDGVVVGTGTTNTSGVATLSYTAPLEVGSKTITVEYAGSAVYGSSVGTGTLTLTTAKTTLTVTNRTTRVNRTVVLTTRLRRVSDGGFVAGASVSISVNGVVVGTAVTDGFGYAQLLYVPQSTGSFLIEASFAGDSVHDPSSDTGTLTVNP